MSSSPNALKVEYPIVSLADLRVVPTSKEHPHPQATRRDSECLAVRGETFLTTGRFWRSLFHRFGISGNIFRYFDHNEVFTRVVQRSPDDRLRLCAERRGKGCPRLLAVSHPNRPLLDYEQAVSLLGRYHEGPIRQAQDRPIRQPQDTPVRQAEGGPVRQAQGGPGDNDGPAYHDGIVSSTHMPRSGQAGSDIGPDRFHNRFVVEAPIDGFGQPRIYLSLLRLICANGAIGYARAFRSDIRIGEDAVYTLERALGQFDHEEGFAALRQRFQSAQKSWASLHEALQLHRVLARLGISGGPYQKELDRLCGDLHALYGLANLESLSVKRQRMLPARCRVYDLLNFASEIATHRAAPESRPRLQAYIGSLVSDEYDLEGTAEKVPEFKDLFLNLN